VRTQSIGAHRESFANLKSSYGDPREPIREVIGDEIGSKIKPIWGLDEEKELRGVWRDLGIPHLWAMMGVWFSLPKMKKLNLNDLLGNLALCRFHSKHVALRTLNSWLINGYA
jgi:hypothetical protein